METGTKDVAIPGIVSGLLLILTALGNAEVMMAVSAVMLVAMVVLHGRMEKAAIWSKLGIVLGAAGIAAAVTLFLRRY